MSDDGEIDAEAACELLPDEFKDTIGSSIKKCASVREYRILRNFEKSWTKQLNLLLLQKIAYKAIQCILEINKKLISTVA